jgi:predicted nucleotidyltransferase
MGTGFSAEADRLLESVVQRIVETFDPERIVLFGSYASGQPAPSSDLDLFIIMENDEERPAQRSARIARILLDIPFPMDIVVRTPEEVEYRLSIGDYFIREILEQGQTLYERN